MKKADAIAIKQGSAMKKADAIAYFGTPTAVAKALGIFPAAVYQWGENVPPRRAYELEKITDGALKADIPYGRAE